MKRNAITIALFLAGLATTAQAGLFVQESEGDESAQEREAVEDTTASASKSAEKIKSSMPPITPDSTRHDGIWWKEGDHVQLWAIGVSPDRNVPPYTGVASSIPLKHALAMIVPSEWTVRVHDSIDDDQLVSWSIESADEATWLDALAEVMKETGTAADVRQFGQRVTILSHIPDSRMAESVETWQAADAKDSGKAGEAEEKTERAERVEPLSASIPNSKANADAETTKKTAVKAERVNSPQPAEAETIKRGPSEFQAGQVELTFGEFMDEWGRTLKWDSSLDNAMTTRFPIPLSGESFDDDLAVILNTLNEGPFRVEADEYQNGIVVISVER